MSSGWLKVRALAPVLIYTALLLVTARYLPVWTKKAAAALTWVVYARVVTYVAGGAALAGAVTLAVFWARMSRERLLFGAALAIWSALAAWFILRLAGSVNEYFHFPEYAALSLLWYRAYAILYEPGAATGASSRKNILRAVALSALTGILEETSQLFIPLRRFDFQDIALNLMGAALGFLFLWAWSAHRPEPRQTETSQAAP
ncbi:VanZ family protein [bacterium]|nr:VanZ family protein [bacterium]